MLQDKSVMLVLPRRRQSRPLSFEPLERRIVLDSTVVFNEVMYHPADSPENALEWVELYNQMAIDMDISGWSLQDGVEFTFPEGTVVPGRGFIVVAADPAQLETTLGFSGATGPLSGQLSNGGENLELVNRDERLMNRLDYGDRGDWPAGPDGSSFTLAKIAENTASEFANNWNTSTEPNGTPGTVNFPAVVGPTSEVFLSSGAIARVHIPADGSLGETWTETNFDDSAWTSASTGVGFGLDGNQANQPPLDGLAFWLDAGDLDGDGNTNNPPHGTAVPSWVDKVSGLHFDQSSVVFWPTLATIGPTATPALIITDNIVTGDWHRVTFNYEIDGPGTTTTVEVFNYNDSSTFTFHADAAVEAFALLDKFVLHDTDPGGTQFDNITVSSPFPTKLHTWKSDVSGDWNQGTNWNPSTIPSTRQKDAIFGDVNTSSRTVFTDLPVTVHSVKFDSSFTYAIAGTGMISLEANSAPELPTITAVQGSHEFQTRVSMVNDTTVDIDIGAVLEFDNDLSLNGNILTKTGAGTMAVNNQLTPGPGGLINVAEGTLSGVGTIGGDLNNDGGTISPGNSLGAMQTVVPEPSSVVLLLLAGWCTLAVAGRQRTTPR